MSQPFIDHGIIKTFAEEKINLPREIAQKFRDQVNRLRERLMHYIAENPGFALVKMLHAGSVAKGMGLRTINDLDAAIYVKKETAPISDHELVPWLAERLREANPNLKPDQFDESQPHCVTVTFWGTDLDVDVVPVLYEGADNDLGYPIDKYTGERLLTSIPRHLEFIRARKKRYPDHYAHVVRLIKWWAQQRKALDSEFKCKSFMIELSLAHLADRGINLADYPQALEGFFSYIVKMGLEERIAFTDYYPLSKLPGPTGAAIEIFDPINPSNNIASKYTLSDRQRLVDAAEEAADTISEAFYATTKSRAVECWQFVFGPSFRS
jgi:tRNA nucleotidyltransferase (CCA-adding enzyme)